MNAIVLLSLAAGVIAVLFLLKRRRPAAGEFAPVARLFNGYGA